MSQLTNAHKKLREIRTRKDLKIRPTKYLKETFTDFAGNEQPLTIRYYQVQGILHMVVMKRFLLGDDTGLGKCSTHRSRIHADEGLITLRDLAPKDVTLQPDTFYPLDHPVKVWTGWKWAPVKSYYYCGVKPTKTVRTRRGYETTGSFVHPLWTRRKEGESFVKLMDAKVGDYLCLERKASIAFPDCEPSLPAPILPEGSLARLYSVPAFLNPELAALLGYVVAEGWVNHGQKFSITQDSLLNPEVHDHIRQLLLRQLHWANDLNCKTRETQIHISSTYLREYLRGLGVGMGTSATKCVPWPIFKGTRASVAAFLRAFFDSEGSIEGDVIEVSSASDQLLKEIQILLLRFGIVCSRRPKKVKGYEHNAYWRIAICGDDARRFHDQIGFLTPRKQEALASLLAKPPNANLDVVPFAQAEVDALRVEILKATSRTGANGDRKGSGIKQFGVSFEKTLNNIRNPTYAFLHKMLEVARAVGVENTEAYQRVDALCQNRFFYDPIEEIIDGEEEVADIEVDDPDHSFVADGFINHNTLQTLAALCYIWEKEPDRKVIILTTKSSQPQWVRETPKFTRGVKVISCAGTKAQREAARKLYEQSKGPTLMVMGYRSAVQDFSAMQDYRDMIMVFDECFDYYTPITLADGTTELIGKIVSKRMPVDVLSRNPVTGVIEPKRVVNWFRNPLKTGRRESLLKLSFRFSNSVRVTHSHKFYAPNGTEIKAGNLKKGSEVQHLCRNTPSSLQWQVILGSLLGDASISMSNHNLWGISLVQSSKRAAYQQVKREILFPLGVSEMGYSTKTGEKAPVTRFRLNGNAAVTSMLVKAGVRRNGKKRVTRDLLDAIDERGLAFWYADDGSLQVHTCQDGRQTYRITLHTQGFSRDEQEVLAGWLQWRWGVRAEVKDDGKRGHSYLYLADAAAQKFLDLLPGSLPGVEYKFPDKAPLRWTGEDITPSTSTVTDWVQDRKEWKPQPKQRYVYDIEVEDNHNYFAGGTLVSNCTAFKNPSTQVHQVCRHLSENADRVYGLTATLLKNNLMEAYGIYQVIVPALFGMSRNAFMLYYCLTKMQQIPGRGNRQVPVIVGYSPEKIKEFRDVIDPYYLGRPKHEVASDLPVLSMMEIECPLTPLQETKYAEALAGMLEMGDGQGGVDVKEVSKLTSIIYCQQIINHPLLIDVHGESPKLEALIEFLTEGDYAEEKVIVYTRFKSLVDIIMTRLAKEKIPAVRITGDENSKQRDAAMQAFQNPKSDVRVACITTAGSEAINLQAAKALVCFDTPFSAGEFLQLVGRMIRIGSTHDRCAVIHLVARGKKKTVDHRVLEILSRKMALFEAVLGKRLKGEGDATLNVSQENDISDLFNSLRQDALDARKEQGKQLVEDDLSDIPL